jgi:hypothetical protein
MSHFVKGSLNFFSTLKMFDKCLPKQTMCHLSFIFVLFVTIEGFLVEGQSSPSSPHPVQLVAPDSSHQNLVLLEENIHYLENIQEITAILSVVGPFHSGKSYLLNSLLGISQNGFQLGE